MTYGIRRVGLTEWRELRALRLEALLDAPLAFSTTYAEATALDDAWWREQAAEGATSADQATFVVTAEGGRWVGLAGSGPLEEVPGTAHIHGVYVAPAHRGRAAGLAGLLMDAGIEWARDNTDASWLTLGVHQDNGRARAFYRRFGFKETGKVVPFALDPSKKVYVMGYDNFR